MVFRLMKGPIKNPLAPSVASSVTTRRTKKSLWQLMLGEFLLYDFLHYMVIISLCILADIVIQRNLVLKQNSISVTFVEKNSKLDVT